jgi:hypothetical protein
MFHMKSLIIVSYHTQHRLQKVTPHKQKLLKIKVAFLSITDPDVQVRPEVSTAAAEAPEVELGRRRLSEDGAEREAQ